MLLIDLQALCLAVLFVLAVAMIGLGFHREK